MSIKLSKFQNNDMEVIPRSTKQWL